MGEVSLASDAVLLEVRAAVDDLNAKLAVLENAGIHVSVVPPQYGDRGIEIRRTNRVTLTLTFLPTEDR